VRSRGAAYCAGAALAASVGLAFVHPWGNVRGAEAGGTILAGSAAPVDLRGLLERKCGDCHSNNTRWPVYSRLAPASWLVEHDVHEGRVAMNLSHWETMRSEDRIAMLARIAAEARSGGMPPAFYAQMHPSARLTGAEREAVAAWAHTERTRIREQSGRMAGKSGQ
jgi:cytochrome c